MSPAESWSLMGCVFAAAYGITALFAAAGRVTEWLMQKLDDKYKRTVYRTTCPRCHRAWLPPVVKAWEPELGADHYIERICPPCSKNALGVFEIDAEGMSLDELRIALREAGYGIDDDEQQGAASLEAGATAQLGKQ